MPPRTPTVAAAWKMGLALPGVEDSETYGTPALKVRGKLMACVPTHKSAEPGSLVVRVDMDRRPDLLEDDPDTYYLTTHYVNYPFVLVRLSRITRDALRDLLMGAWRLGRARAHPDRPGSRPGARKRKG